MPSHLTSHLADPLLGCLLEAPGRWQGLYKVLACPEDRQQALLRHPGVWVYDNPKRPKESGWYAPRSLLDMGRYPALLHEYPAEHYDVTPLGGRRLFDHQARACSFLRLVTPEREGAILGAEMGAGKTCAALQALYLDSLLQQPGLIVAPKLARGTWCGPGSDATRFYGMDVQPLRGVKNFDPGVLQRHPHFFIHFDILKAWQAWIFELLKPAWLIIDELHFVTHRAAGRSKAVRNISMAASIQKRFGLTGSPVTNERLDLWHQFCCVQPRQWGTNPHPFGVRYAGGRRSSPEEGGHWVFDDLTRATELRARAAGSLLIYTKEEVKQDLPPYNRKIVYLTDDELDADLMATYRHAQRDIVGHLQNIGKLAKTSQTFRIGTTEVHLSANDVKPEAIQLRGQNEEQRLLGLLKTEPAKVHADRILQDHTHLILFCARVETVQVLYAHFLALWDAGGALGSAPTQPFGPVHGKMAHKKRFALAALFSAAPRGIYVTTLDAIQVSINDLARADSLLFTDLFWNTVRLTQGESRAHRIGNPNPQVDGFFLVAKGTLDEQMIAKLQYKAPASASMHDVDTMGLSLVQDLTPQGNKAKGSDIDALCDALSYVDEPLSCQLGDRPTATDENDWCSHEYNTEGFCDLCGEVHPESAEGMFGLMSTEAEVETVAYENMLEAQSTGDNLL